MLALDLYRCLEITAAGDECTAFVVAADIDLDDGLGVRRPAVHSVFSATVCH